MRLISAPWAIRLRAAVRCRALPDVDRRADIDPVVEVDDVGNVHPHAAVRGRGADRVVLVGPVEADPAGDADPAFAERVLRRPAGDDGPRKLTGPGRIRNAPDRV